MDGLERVTALPASEIAVMPDLPLNTSKYSRGYAAAYQHLQMEEWAFETYFAGAIVDEVTGRSLEYRDLIKDPKRAATWQTSLANELGRLSQGIRDIKGTDTIFFISKSEIPKDRLKEVTYARIVVDYKPNKLEKNRTRVTVGGDRINCPFDCGTPTADVPVIKLLWNSTISTPGAKYFTLDISNFYLGALMERPEYMKMPLKIMPPKKVGKYNLKELEVDGWVYLKIIKGVYDLPQDENICK